jgi:hypothetical protein
VKFFEYFRRSPRICDAHALADFIDENAAFLVQKGMYEYSRARAGHYAKVLFREPAFLDAMEASRWRAYPLGLAMVAEVVDGILRPSYTTDRQAAIEGLRALSLSVFDRYPVPAQVGEQAWADARVELSRKLQLIGLHAPKRVIDIPENVAHVYFNMMPIHEKLRGSDFPTIRNYLRVVLLNVHDTLSKTMDAPAIAAALPNMCSPD